MTFDAKAFAATMRAFNRKKFPSPDAIVAVEGPLQETMREAFVLAAVRVRVEGKEALVSIDQAPESLEQFKGQNGRVLFTFVWADNSELVYASTKDLNA